MTKEPPLAQIQRGFHSLSRLIHLQAVTKRGRHFCLPHISAVFDYFRFLFHSEYIRNTVEPRRMPTARAPAMAAVCIL